MYVYMHLNVHPLLGNFQGIHGCMYTYMQKVKYSSIMLKCKHKYCSTNLASSYCPHMHHFVETKTMGKCYTHKYHLRQGIKPHSN